MMRLFLIIVNVAILLFLSACTSLQGSPSPLSSAPTESSASVQKAQEQFYRESGLASWYGREYHGKKTANGEVFDMYGISAAHRILPLGTVVRVTNLDNSKSILVRINDRGPFIKSRILELSYGSAQELGCVERGIAHVKLEATDITLIPARYTVLAAVYTEEDSAKTLKYRLSSKFEVVTITQLETNIATFFTVRVGIYPSQERAEQIVNKLRMEGLEPLVLRKD